MYAIFAIGYIITSITLGQTTIETPKYGYSNVTATPYINLGKIRGINPWGYDYDTWLGAISQFSWNHGYPSLYTSIIFGNETIQTSCQSFILSTNDYINGYRIIIEDGGDIIFGITFYTHLNLTYQCQWNSLDSFNNKNDSGIIKYPGYYLSGFYIIAEDVINQIGFQFTSISPSTSGIYIYSNDNQTCIY